MVGLADQASPGARDPTYQFGDGAKRKRGAT